MFKVNESYEVDRRIPKCDYMRYSPAETSTINLPNSQIYIKIPRENTVISLLNSFLESNFEVVKEAGYANGDDIRLVNLGQIALFSNFLLTTSSEKHLADNSHCYILSLMYKLLTLSRCSDDLSFGFDRDRNRSETN